MPTLPAAGYPVPTAPRIEPLEELPRGGGYQRIDAPVQAFGGGTAEGLQVFGQQAAQAAAHQYARAEFLNLTEADKAIAAIDDAARLEKYGDPTAGVDPITGRPLVPGFKTRLGSDAIDYIQSGEPNKRFAAIVDRAAAGASSNAVRQMILSKASERRAAFATSLDEHFNVQLLAHNEQVQKYRAAGAAQEAALGVDDDKAILGAADKLYESYVAQSFTSDPATLGGLRAKADADAAEQAIDAALAKNDPARAQQIYNNHSAGMPGDRQLKLKGKIQPALDDQLARRATSGVNEAARAAAASYAEDSGIISQIDKSVQAVLETTQKDPDPTVQADLRNKTRAAIAGSAIEAALAAENPTRAARLLQTYSDSMSGEKLQQYHQQIKPLIDKQIAGRSAGHYIAPPGPAIEGASQQEQLFLNEARFRESGSRYDLIHPPVKTGPHAGETAKGAYGFLDSSWKELTAGSGIGAEYPTADKAPPAVQDANALWFHRKYGTDPWKASGPYPAGRGADTDLEADFAKRSGAFGTPQEAAKNLTSVTAPSGAAFTVHKLAAPQIQGFINELEGMGYKIDATTSGAYNDRNKVGVGSVEKSEHAYGTAFDINWNRNKQADTLITDLPANVSEIAAKWGLKWGGDFRSKKDAMHFEVARLLPGGAAPRAAAAAPAPTPTVPATPPAVAPLPIPGAASATPSTSMAPAPEPPPIATPGQRAYEADLAEAPTYPDGGARPPWGTLNNERKAQWEARGLPARASPAPAGAVEVWGDSLGVGLKGQLKTEGTAVGGAQPAAILANIKAKPGGYWDGKTVVLSSGSNGNQMDKVEETIDHLQSKNATVVLVGYGPKFPEKNQKLREIAQMYNAKVIDAEDVAAGEGVHPSPRGYASMAGKIRALGSAPIKVPPANAAPPPGMVAPGNIAPPPA